MTYTIAVCTVKNSWWRTEELSETCRVLFQKWIWEINASSWFYYKNLSIFSCIYYALASVTPKITVWQEVSLYSLVEEYRRFIRFTWPFLLVLFNKNSEFIPHLSVNGHLNVKLVQCMFGSALLCPLLWKNTTTLLSSLQTLRWTWIVFKDPARTAQ